MTGARFITQAELERLMPMIENDGCLLVDIRSPAEFHSGHLLHARLIPVEDLDKRVGELDCRKGLVIYCRSGRRCLRVLPILTDRGSGEVLILEGGLERWTGGLVYD